MNSAQTFRRSVLLLKPTFRNTRSASSLIRYSLAAALVVCAASAPAASLIWDPLGNNSGGGSGNWDTTAGNAVWWNGTTDVIWSQTGTNNPSNAAIFNGPDAAPGTYMVTNDANELAINNLQINANGYVFSGANEIFVNSSDVLTVAAGKTVTFNCPMGGSATDPSWELLPGATMNVTGNLVAAPAMQLRLAGGAGSAYNLSGPASIPGIFSVLGQVNVTGGSLTPNSSTFIGFENLNVIDGTTYTTGTLTVSGASTTVTVNGNILIIGRSSGTGTLAVQNGTVSVGNLTAARNLAIDYDGSAGSSGTVNVSGGTLNVGSPTQLANQIAFFQTGASAPNATGTFIQSAGTINAWGGIIFGLGGGTGTAAMTNSGGTLYVGGGGITKNAAYTGPFNITLSGGIVGPLAAWASPLPMTLATSNGNITFQCADSNGTPRNISLSGPLTGAGGLNVTGTGTLTLSGANNYSGTTAVSNGTLAIITGTVPITNGPVTLDGSAGSPVVSVTVTTAGQFWTNNGAFTFQNGAPTANFQFGSLSPSTTVAPIQVAGSVNFTVSPSVNVSGAAIAAGTYPLIKYTGAVNGALPSSVTINLSGGSASGNLTNNTTTKTIALVVTSSTFNPALSWRVGNGVWDINTTSDWTQFGGAVKYTDGSAVVFDDTATGPAPIAITLNTTVNPLNVTFNNASPTNYTIAGSGNIAGSVGVSLLNSGKVTLASENTYNGGTVISAGQLNINNGGTGTGSAIGTGQLTLNGGAVIDNTSGSDVTLLPSIPEAWNGNFTYAGASNNFNTGPGQVTMNNSVSVTVGSNNLTVGGNISDNGNSLQLSKTGNGTLTLPVDNSFSGGLSLSSGGLNLGSGAAAGTGIFTITGGTIDNTSSGLVVLQPVSYVWGGSFSFRGTSPLALAGNISIPNGLGNITVNIASNILTTGGVIVNNNTEVIKTGNGTWVMAGPAGGESLGLVVTAGEVDLNKSGGQAITGGNNVGLTVQTNALVQDEGNNQIHSDSAVALPVNLFGGVWDLNGFNENVDLLSFTSGGTLRNNSATTTSTINLISGHTASLGGVDLFDVTNSAVLVFKGPIGGSGSLVKIGAGALNLASNNVYTGSTVISNGTIALPGVGSLSNTVAINLATTNSALDVSGNNTPVLTLLSGQTLSGFGSVTGAVQTLSGSTLAPGNPSTIGTLTVTGDPNTLNGTTLMKLDKGNSTNDTLVVSGGLTYGGTLALANLSGTLAIGDSFTLFSAGGGLSGAFASISPSQPGSGLAWNTNNLVPNGILSVMTGPIITSPKITGISLSGTTLTINGTNGPAHDTFVVLTSTNITTHLANWVPVSTNTFDGSGNFSVSLGWTNQPQAFFAVQVH